MGKKVDQGLVRYSYDLSIWKVPANKKGLLAITKNKIVIVKVFIIAQLKYNCHCCFSV